MNVSDEAASECDSCGEGDAEQCPKSRRPCGHHCNHSWSHDACCWCGKEWPAEELEVAAEQPVPVDCATMTALLLESFRRKP